MLIAFNKPFGVVDARANDLNVQSGSPPAKDLLDNLPVYPDNLMGGRDGRTWIGLFKPRNSAADALPGRPFLVFLRQNELRAAPSDAERFLSF